MKLFAKIDVRGQHSSHVVMITVTVKLMTMDTFMATWSALRSRGCAYGHTGMAAVVTTVVRLYSHLHNNCLFFFH